MKITWGELLDRFGPQLSAAGFNPWAVKDGLATRETVQHVSVDRAIRLGMSEQESLSREKLYQLESYHV